MVQVAAPTSGFFLVIHKMAAPAWMSGCKLGGLLLRFFTHVVMLRVTIEIGRQKAVGAVQRLWWMWPFGGLYCCPKTIEVTPRCQKPTVLKEEEIKNVTGDHLHKVLNYLPRWHDVLVMYPRSHKTKNRRPLTYPVNKPESHTTTAEVRMIMKTTTATWSFWIICLNVASSNAPEHVKTDVEIECYFEVIILKKQFSNIAKEKKTSSVCLGGGRGNKDVKSSRWETYITGWFQFFPIGLSVVLLRMCE